MIFRGDHIHAGVRGTGYRQCRHVHLAEVKRKADALKEPNRVTSALLGAERTRTFIATPL